MPSTLTYQEAVSIIGGLSKTSKMPWYSWSTSAFDCITGSRLRQVEGSVCSNCYACKGCYVFSSVKQAHDRKLKALQDPRFVEAFTVVLTNLYERTRKTYVKDGKVIKENRFRWHDSGDIQSIEHLEMINQIALNCPFIDFWLPTKEVGMIRGRTFAPNLTVRVSHPMIGETFKEDRVPFVYSTVGYDKSEKNCYAQQNDGKCGDCSMCWDKSIKAINYKEH